MAILTERVKAEILKAAYPRGSFPGGEIQKKADAALSLVTPVIEQLGTQFKLTELTPKSKQALNIVLGKIINRKLFVTHQIENEIRAIILTQQLIAQNLNEIAQVLESSPIDQKAIMIEQLKGLHKEEKQSSLIKGDIELIFAHGYAHMTNEDSSAAHLTDTNIKNFEKLQWSNAAIFRLLKATTQTSSWMLIGKIDSLRKKIISFLIMLFIDDKNNKQLDGVRKAAVAAILHEHDFANILHDLQQTNPDIFYYFSIYDNIEALSELITDMPPNKSVSASLLNNNLDYVTELSVSQLAVLIKISALTSQQLAILVNKLTGQRKVNLAQAIVESGVLGQNISAYESWQYFQSLHFTTDESKYLFTVTNGLDFIQQALETDAALELAFTKQKEARQVDGMQKTSGLSRGMVNIQMHPALTKAGKEAAESIAIARSIFNKAQTDSELSILATVLTPEKIIQLWNGVFQSDEGKGITNHYNFAKLCQLVCDNTQNNVVKQQLVKILNTIIQKDHIKPIEKAEIYNFLAHTAHNNKNDKLAVEYYLAAAKLYADSFKTNKAVENIKDALLLLELKGEGAFNAAESSAIKEQIVSWPRLILLPVITAATKHASGRPIFNLVVESPELLKELVDDPSSLQKIIKDLLSAEKTPVLEMLADMLLTTPQLLHSVQILLLSSNTAEFESFWSKYAETLHPSSNDNLAIYYVKHLTKDYVSKLSFAQKNTLLIFLSIAKTKVNDAMAKKTIQKQIFELFPEEILRTSAKYIDNNAVVNFLLDASNLNSIKHDSKKLNFLITLVTSIDDVKRLLDTYKATDLAVVITQAILSNPDLTNRIADNKELEKEIKLRIIKDKSALLKLTNEQLINYLQVCITGKNDLEVVKTILLDYEGDFNSRIKLLELVLSKNLIHRQEMTSKQKIDFLVNINLSATELILLFNLKSIDSEIFATLTKNATLSKLFLKVPADTQWGEAAKTYVSKQLDDKRWVAMVNPGEADLDRLVTLTKPTDNEKTLFVNSYLFNSQLEAKLSSLLSNINFINLTRIILKLKTAVNNNFPFPTMAELEALFNKCINQIDSPDLIEEFVDNFFLVNHQPQNFAAKKILEDILLQLLENFTPVEVGSYKQIHLIANYLAKGVTTLYDPILSGFATHVNVERYESFLPFSHALEFLIAAEQGKVAVDHGVFESLNEIHQTFQFHVAMRSTVLTMGLKNPSLYSNKADAKSLQQIAKDLGQTRTLAAIAQLCALPIDDENEPKLHALVEAALVLGWEEELINENFDVKQYVLSQYVAGKISVNLKSGQKAILSQSAFELYVDQVFELGLFPNAVHFDLPSVFTQDARIQHLYQASSTDKLLKKLLEIDIQKLTKDTANIYGQLIYGIVTNPASLYQLEFTILEKLFKKIELLQASKKFIEVKLLQKVRLSLGESMNNFTLQDICILHLMLNVSNKHEAAEFISFVKQNALIEKIKEFFYELDSVENIDQIRIDILFKIATAEELAKIIAKCQEKNNPAIAQKLLIAVLNNPSYYQSFNENDGNLIKVACKNWKIENYLDLFKSLDPLSEAAKSTMALHILSNNQINEHINQADLEVLLKHINIHSNDASLKQLMAVVENFENSQQPRNTIRKFFEDIISNLQRRNELFDNLILTQDKTKALFSLATKNWQLADFIEQRKIYKDHAAKQFFDWYLLTRKDFVDVLPIEELMPKIMACIITTINQVTMLDVRVRVSLFNDTAKLNQLCQLITGMPAENENIQELFSGFNNNDVITIAKNIHINLSDINRKIIFDALVVRHKHEIIAGVISNADWKLACMLLQHLNKQDFKSNDQIKSLIICAFRLNRPNQNELLEQGAIAVHQPTLNSLISSVLVGEAINNHWDLLTSSADIVHLPFYKFLLGSETAWKLLDKNKRDQAIKNAIKSGVTPLLLLKIKHVNLSDEYLFEYFKNANHDLSPADVKALEEIIKTYIGNNASKLNQILQYCKVNAAKIPIVSEALFASPMLEACADIALGANNANTDEQNVARAIMQQKFTTASDKYWDEFSFSTTHSIDQNLRYKVLDATYESAELSTKEANIYRGEVPTKAGKAIIAARHGRERDKLTQQGGIAGLFYKIAYWFNDLMTGSWDFLKSYRETKTIELQKNTDNKGGVTIGILQDLDAHPHKMSVSTPGVQSNSVAYKYKSPAGLTTNGYVTSHSEVGDNKVEVKAFEKPKSQAKQLPRARSSAVPIVRSKKVLPSAKHQKLRY